MSFWENKSHLSLVKVLEFSYQLAVGTLVDNLFLILNNAVQYIV